VGEYSKVIKNKLIYIINVIVNEKNKNNIKKKYLKKY
jgi:hypothetical protein